MLQPMTNSLKGDWFRSPSGVGPCIFRKKNPFEAILAREQFFVLQ
jgi:hypothetical protein